MGGNHRQCSLLVDELDLVFGVSVRLRAPQADTACRELCLRWFLVSQRARAGAFCNCADLCCMPWTACVRACVRVCPGPTSSMDWLSS